MLRGEFGTDLVLISLCCILIYKRELFAFISLGKRELFALLKTCTVFSLVVLLRACILAPLLMVVLDGLRFVNAAFPGSVAHARIQKVLSSFDNVF